MESLMGGVLLAPVFFCGYFRKKNVLGFFFSDFGAKRRFFFGYFIGKARRSGKFWSFLVTFVRKYIAGVYYMPLWFCIEEGRVYYQHPSCWFRTAASGVRPCGSTP